MPTNRRTEPTTVQRAQSLRGRGHISSYGDGRTCAVPGCRTIVSRYNESDRCWQHAEELTRAEPRR
jgi:hypothetical protein